MPKVNMYRRLRAKNLRNTILVVILIWLYALLCLVPLGGLQALTAASADKLSTFPTGQYESAGYVELDIYEVYEEVRATYSNHRAFVVAAPQPGHYMVVDFHQDDKKNANTLAMHAGQGPAAEPVLTVKGTMEAITLAEGVGLSYRGFRYDHGLTGEELDPYFLPVSLLAGKYEGSDTTTSRILLWIACTAVAGGLLLLLVGISGRMQKTLRTGIPPAQIDEWFAGASSPAPKVWVREDFLVKRTFLRTVCVPLDGMVWAYLQRTSINLIPVLSFLQLMMADRRTSVGFTMRKAHVEDTLRILQHYRPRATYGYTHAVLGQYKRDPYSLLKPPQGENKGA